jgi:hypothetical protein
MWRQHLFIGPTLGRNLKGSQWLASRQGLTRCPLFNCSTSSAQPPWPHTRPLSIQPEYLMIMYLQACLFAHTVPVYRTAQIVTSSLTVCS